MTNPRDRIGINRPLTPPPAAAPTTSPQADADPAPTRRPNRPAKKAVAEQRLLGKRQGNMRCIGLYLPHDAAQQLRQLATNRHVPIGEALMDLIDTADQQPPPATPRREGRVHRRTALDRPQTIYVLVTDNEARTLGLIVETSGRRISQYTTDLLMQIAPNRHRHLPILPSNR